MKKLKINDPHEPASPLLQEQGSSNRSHIKLYYSRTGQRNSLSPLLQEQGSGMSLFIGISLLFSLLSQIWV